MMSSDIQLYFGENLSLLQRLTLILQYQLWYQGKKKKNPEQNRMTKCNKVSHRHPVV